MTQTQVPFYIIGCTIKLRGELYDADKLSFELVGPILVGRGPALDFDYDLVDVYMNWSFSEEDLFIHISRMGEVETFYLPYTTCFLTTNFFTGSRLVFVFGQGDDEVTLIASRSRR